MNDDATTEMHTRDARLAVLKPALMNNITVTSDHIGMVYVERTAGMVGSLMTNQAFLEIPASEVNTWYRISELDVTTW